MGKGAHFEISNFLDEPVNVLFTGVQGMYQIPDPFTVPKRNTVGNKYAEATTAAVSKFALTMRIGPDEGSFGFNVSSSGFYVNDATEARIPIGNANAECKIIHGGMRGPDTITIHVKDRS